MDLSIRARPRESDPWHRVLEAMCLSHGVTVDSRHVVHRRSCKRVPKQTNLNSQLHATP